MIEWRRMSTCSCRASSAARTSGRTLKPMMTTARPEASVCDAAARRTSDSVIAPTPERMTLTLTVSVESLVSVLFKTSSEHFDGGGGARFVNVPAAVVIHGAHLAENLADDERVADAQRALLDEDGRDRAASPVEFGFQHHAGGESRRARLQVQNVGGEQDGFEKRVEVLSTLRRDG